MGHRASAKTPPLYPTGEAFALRRSSHINVLALGERYRSDCLSHLVLGGVRETKLAQKPMRLNIAPLEVALLGFVDPRLTYRLKGYLNGRVTICVIGLDLSNGAGACLNYGYRHHDTFVCENLSHTNFLA